MVHGGAMSRLQQCATPTERTGFSARDGAFQATDVTAFPEPVTPFSQQSVIRIDLPRLRL